MSFACARGLDAAQARPVLCSFMTDRGTDMMRATIGCWLGASLLVACGAAEDPSVEEAATDVELGSVEQSLTGCRLSPFPRPVNGRDERCTFTFNGATREYYVHIPPPPAGGVSAGSMAVVMEMHGGGGVAPPPLTQTLSGWEQVADTEALANRQSFYVIWPTGRGPAWWAPDWYTCDYNGPSCPPPGGSNERAFLVAVINDLKARTNTINANRIYATGLSSGAAMAQILACDHADKFAAVAPMAGGIVSQQQSPEYNYDLRPRCNPTRKVPHFYAHAAQDAVVPVIEGVMSRNFWLTKLGCNLTPSVSSFDDDRQNDPSVCNTHTCQANTKLQFCVLDASKNPDGFGGHTIWAADDLEAPSIAPEVGGAPHRLARLAWDFMRQFTLTNSGY
jgi:poly(3-hydroxybutyrate) depolymerase